MIDELQKEISLDEEVLESMPLTNERNKAKLAKNYALADEIRENLLKKGIVLKDTKEGTTYSFK